LEQSTKEAAKDLRQSKSRDEKDAARGKLVELLGEDYDARLAEYEKYLDELEERLVSMRDKLAKRRDAKEKMIELRIEVLKAEADDLGWPSRMNRSWGSGFPRKLESSKSASSPFSGSSKRLPDRSTKSSR
jgi:chromosome segregation ATPase